MNKTEMKKFIRQSANCEILVGAHGRWTVILDSQGTMAAVTTDEKLPSQMVELGATVNPKDIASVAEHIVTGIADYDGHRSTTWMDVCKDRDSRIVLISDEEPNTIAILNPKKWDVFRNSDNIYVSSPNSPVLFRRGEGEWGYVLPIRANACTQTRDILLRAAKAWT